jgi:hypothetical protein
MKQWATLAGMASCMAFQLGGCALPENFWVGKWGEIVNGLIISGINLGLAGTGTGLQI